MSGTCTRGTEPSCSLKCGEFLGWLRTGQLLKEGRAACSKSAGLARNILNLGSRREVRGQFRALTALSLEISMVPIK